MSYDIMLGVKVEGAKDLIAVIAEPETASPTYNIRKMLRKAMRWDFETEHWYKVTEVLPHINFGIHELMFHEQLYKIYNPPNGYGSTTSALKALVSLKECIANQVSGEWTWQAIPIECLYMRW